MRALAFLNPGRNVLADNGGDIRLTRELQSVHESCSTTKHLRPTQGFHGL